MSRPLNKIELAEFAENEFKRLNLLLGNLSSAQRDCEFVFANRTAKDIVAHLLAWQLLELDWYRIGMSGVKPEIPAPGFTFRDTPALNEKLYQDYKHATWDEIIKKITQTHKELLSIIHNHTNEELFTKKKYIWCGTSDMAVYLRSALSSHYLWAINLIRKHFKIKV